VINEHLYYELTAFFLSSLIFKLPPLIARFASTGQIVDEIVFGKGTGGGFSSDSDHFTSVVEDRSLPHDMPLLDMSQ